MQKQTWREGEVVWLVTVISTKGFLIIAVEKIYFFILGSRGSFDTETLGSFISESELCRCCSIAEKLYSPTVLRLYFRPKRHGSRHSSPLSQNCQSQAGEDFIDYFSMALVSDVLSSFDWPCLSCCFSDYRWLIKVLTCYAASLKEHPPFLQKRACVGLSTLWIENSLIKLVVGVTTLYIHSIISCKGPTWK